MNIKKVLKSTFVSIIAVLAAANLTALEVNRNELESAPNGDEVVFRNYSGPHTVINTIEQIRAIGSALGNQVKANPENTGLIGSPNKYSVIHAIDPSTKEKMDADIFIIGKGATVDHITNLRRIISAYLESAYGYSTKDAGTIATFITVYNAVYRGKIEYFQSKYKDIVIKNLSASIVGLSTNYEEWPGKTQIVIPLSDLSGGLSTIDTSLISDKQVVKSMQGEDDKGIDARKDMVDIKEREADNLQEKADSKQSKADEEKAKLAEEQKKKAEADAAAAKKKADADKAKAEADKKKADADKAKKDARANPNDKQAQKDAADAQKEADQAQKDADQAQKDADAAQKDADEQAQKTDEQAQKTDEAQKDADQAQAQADKKRDEAQEERTSIAKDQQSLIREASYTKSGEHIMYGLKNVDDEGVMSAIVKMNSVNGAVIKESPVDVIRCRTVFDDGSWFIAVAGSNAANGVVRLVQIDKQNLEISAESNEKLSDLSTLVEKDGSYYCTVQDGADYYIGKFNNTVQSQLISKVKVKGATPITITSQGIMVTSANGKPIILSLEDLTSISPE
ncbi:hypothetical protein DYE50_04850 [Treponema ruminis]|uniref:Glucan-binding YG repeat protein n=1 Tax=Treponema ruminis TaxID=744515 RepID=A0A7W8LLA0_9SPIR|nr:P83/100 family protein [Treponema ruminis]MBB5225226.1 glucan-binding YG repeat protein [Treponema ruminis]QSI01903.1 hypothetical protein DYE50_04850 [Treponema ruminis]